ncbi:MAG TPA: cyclase family protein [Pseudonocardia sp.]|jgi:kynurenine formamidase|nr:cyclase family protein [Pseudonocardia sp.]
MRIVDLSVPVRAGMQVYPGDPAVQLDRAVRLEVDGVNVLAIHAGSHTGTHVDAPFHVLADGARLDELDLGLFHGPAVVADVRGLPPRAAIGWAALEPYAPRLGPGVVLVLHTGWSAHFGTQEYLAHPWLTADAARRIVATGVRTVALDALSPDPTESASEGDGPFPAHRVLLGAGGVIVENLTNVAAMAELPDPVLSCFPLALAGADGAPVRAVAMSAPA